MPDSSAQPFSGIFVSYRRDDASGHAGRLFDRLVSHFGKDRIFMDIDTIDPGEDFVTVIQNAVGSCDILVAVIGRQWLSSADNSSRRLDNPNDFVRLEITAALDRDIRVIPVLVQRASMPNPQDLPDDLARFSRRNAIELSDLRWQHDVERLISIMEKVLAKREEEARLTLAARQAEEDRLRLAEAETRRVEEQKQRQAQEEVNRHNAEARRRSENEVARREAEQVRRKAEEASRLRADAEMRRTMERLRAGLAPDGEWLSLALEEQARAEKDNLKPTIEETALPGLGDPAVHLIREENQTTPDSVGVRLPRLSTIRWRKPLVIICFVVIAVALTWSSQLSKRKPSVNRPGPSTFTNKYGIEMAYVPQGEFVMGNDKGNVNEQPAHRVRISEGFYIGKYEVTQKQWLSVMATKILLQHKYRAHFFDAGEGDDYPVYYVSWQATQEFIQKLNELQDGYKYRLPTEAEWEYACRAGTTGDYAGDLEAMAWYGEKHPVGTKQPNAFGLYDMHGNVGEWCQDWYDPNYYKSSPSIDPQGPGTGEHRITRGGSWLAGTCLQSWCRSYEDAYPANSITGFRVIAKNQ